VQSLISLYSSALLTRSHCDNQTPYENCDDHGMIHKVEGGAWADAYRDREETDQRAKERKTFNYYSNPSSPSGAHNRQYQTGD
jgi:hypothetical protein